MGVTELAFMQLRDDYDELDFLEVLMQCQEVQDEWILRHQPDALRDKPTPNLSTFCLQRTSPSYLLINAPWSSPLAHHIWIESSENKEVFGKLIQYIQPDAMVFFHMEAAGKGKQLKADRFARDKFHVSRISVSPEKRKIVEEKYLSIEGKVAELGPDTDIWGGWRIEKANNLEQLIVYWSRSVPTHLVQELLGMSEEETEIHHFQNVV